MPPAEVASAPTEEPSERTERPDAGAQALINELRAAATDSRDPNRLERAVRDAFAFLGFRAEWLGGSGKTDVLLDAMLGRDDSYRVILDCKSVGSGTLVDQQIDWVTLGEHKQKHDAQYVGVVGPRPSGSRLFERARQHEVAVISVERLVGLCSQHAKTPLTLDDYRALFVGGAEPDTQALDERAEEVARQTRLVAAVCDAIRERSGTFGRLTARDLYLILAPELGEDVTRQDELQTVLDVLSSPVLEVLDGDAAAGYRVTTSTDVAGSRVRTVAEALQGDA